MERAKNQTPIESTSATRSGSGMPLGAVGPARPLTPPSGGSTFPSDTVARIWRPSRSVTTSGKARTKNWLLRFEQRRPFFIEPLMGWTGGDDMLAQVELAFPSLEAAVAYAEARGLAYEVHTNERAGHDTASCGTLAWRRDGETQISGDALTLYLFCSLLRTNYGQYESAGLLPDLERALINPTQVFRSPREVVDHPVLSRQSKREILEGWAWDAHLLEVASDEGMPEGHESSQLYEVRLTLLDLEAAERETGPSPCRIEHGALHPRDGRPVNAHMADYLVPVNIDIPGLEAHFVEEEDPHVNPLGVKGLGEITLVGTAPAIANSVFHATGKRVRNLPIRIEDMMTA